MDQNFIISSDLKSFAENLSEEDDGPVGTRIFTKHGLHQALSTVAIRARMFHYGSEVGSSCRNAHKGSIPFSWKIITDAGEVSAA